jgi:hypothetical protein
VADDHETREVVMRSHRVAAALAAAILVLVSSSGPAAAATVSQKDAVGDAAARFDIVRISYTNNATAFRYRMKLNDITPKSGTLAFPKLLIHGTWDRFFQVVSGARRDGTRFHRLEFNSPTSYHRVRCPAMTARVDFATDVVTARVPQRCLDRVGFGHLRYRVVGYAATPGMQEAGDETGFRWVDYN